MINNTFISDPDFYFSISAEQRANAAVIHKFGRNLNSTTTYATVSQIPYRTPTVSNATKLRVKAGNAADDVAGVGARKILLEGLSATGEVLIEELETNGTSAGTESTETFLRLYRVKVSESGVYANFSTLNGSHVGAVVIENAAGTEDWACIDATDFPRGQGEICAYTVPLNKIAYIASASVNAESTKATDFVLLQRAGILKETAPYDPMKMVFQLGSVVGEEVIPNKSPLGPYVELTDLVFISRLTSGAGETDAEFEIILLDA